MAFNIATMSEYTQKSTEILREGVLFNDNFSEFQLQTGISYKEYLNFLDATPTLVAGTCGIVDGGNTVLTEREIEVIPMMSNSRFCFDTLYQLAVTEEDVAASLTLDTVNKLSQSVEQTIWQGDALGNDGWLTQLHADAALVSLGDATVLSATNIDEKISDMIVALPDATYTRGILTLYVSYAVYNMYKSNRIGAVAANFAEAGFGVNQMWLFGYEGQITIKAVQGLVGVNDDMILTWSKNLVIGTDEISTVSTAKWVIDEVNDYAWLKARFKLGTSYKYAGEAVSYK